MKGVIIVRKPNNEKILRWVAPFRRLLEVFSNNTIKILRQDCVIPNLSKCFHGLGFCLRLAIGTSEWDEIHVERRKPRHQIPRCIHGGWFRLLPINCVRFSTLSEERGKVNNFASNCPRSGTTFFGTLHERIVLLAPVEHLRTSREDNTTTEPLTLFEVLILPILWRRSILPAFLEHIGHCSGHGDYTEASSSWEGRLTITLLLISCLSLAIRCQNVPPVIFNCFFVSRIMNQRRKRVCIKENILPSTSTCIFLLNRENRCQKSLKVVCLWSQTKSPIRFTIPIMILSIDTFTDSHHLFNSIRGTKSFIKSLLIP
mmetsp:Transcript_12350/g.18977  ORF Transcript_12350/g.18977 Transcript_12350/m.18977 type:complete len:315 (-) Transcript_12350:839-1783(-)